MLKIRGTEGVRTYFSLLRDHWRSQTVSLSVVSAISDAATVVAKVVEVGVEAVFSSREVDRRVLTADFGEALGLIPCEQALFSPSAKQRTAPWIGASDAHSRLQ